MIGSFVDDRILLTAHDRAHHPHRGRSRNRRSALLARGSAAAAGVRRDRHARLRRREAGYAGLCAIVCGAAAVDRQRAAIWGRLFAAFDPFHHDALRRARADKLARLGLSRPKIKAIKAIAQGDREQARSTSTRSPRCDADEAHAALTALHGIGPWTADIYLLFCLGHADAWPAGDLALQEAARIAFGLRRRPDAKAMVRIAETWRPWRGVAAHLLWAYYRVVKRREGARCKQTIESSHKNNNENGGRMAAELDGPRLEPRPDRRSSWWCSCTATAPTATT